MTLQQRPWLRHYPPGVPATLTYPEESLVQPLIPRRNSSPRPACDAVFRQADHLPRAVGPGAARWGALAEMGVRKGDRVAIMLPNSPQCVIAYYAALWLGAVVVMVNPLYTPRELKTQLSDSGARHIIVLDIMYPEVAEVRRDTALERVVVTGLAEYLPFPLSLVFPLQLRRQGQLVRVPSAPHVTRWSELLRQAPLSEPVPVNAREDPRRCSTRGGTTGTPKGAMLTHFNLYANCVQIGAWLSEFKEDHFRVLAALPFFHVYGLTTVLNYTVFGGGTMILIPRFDINQVLGVIRRHRPHIFPGAPTMYVAVVNHPDRGR